MKVVKIRNINSTNEISKFQFILREKCLDREECFDRQERELPLCLTEVSAQYQISLQTRREMPLTDEREPPRRMIGVSAQCQNPECMGETMGV